MPKKKGHLHCSRKCFDKEYYKTVISVKEKYPSYACQKCGKKFQLDFNPTIKVNLVKLKEIICPYCEAKRKEI